MGQQLGDHFIESNPYTTYLPYSEFFHAQDRKSSGVAGGQANPGFNDRVLNTEVSPPVSWASLASNQITLAAGTYDVLLDAPAKMVDTYYNVLRDTSNNILIQGISGYLAAGGYVEVFSNPAFGRLVLASQTTVKVSTYAMTLKATDGLGVAAGVTPEIYANIMIWKVSA